MTRHRFLSPCFSAFSKQSSLALFHLGGLLLEVLLTLGHSGSEEAVAVLDGSLFVFVHQLHFGQGVVHLL